MNDLHRLRDIYFVHIPISLMQRFPKTLLILSLATLASAVSLSLITASMLIVDHLRDHLPVAVSTPW